MEKISEMQLGSNILATGYYCLIINKFMEKNFKYVTMLCDWQNHLIPILFSSHVFCNSSTNIVPLTNPTSCSDAMLFKSQ